MITYNQCETRIELEQILALQQQNLPENLCPTELRKEGFVTIKHDMALLKAMNTSWPHTLAKVNDQVIGYALSMHPSFGKEIELLVPMFEQLAQLGPDYRNSMIMGQICIAKAYRGKGVFRALYEAMKGFLGNGFTKIVTEIDAKNKRSLHAHLSIGFREVLRYQYAERTWVLVVL